MKIKIILFFIFMSSLIRMRAMDCQMITSPTPTLSILEKTFLKASFDGDVTLFSECLAKGVDCNISDNNVISGCGHGHTALHAICMSGQYLLLPLILNASGIDVNKTDKEGNTVLHYAANHNASQTSALHALLFALLIKRGANVNAQNKNLETPLSTLLTKVGQPTQLCEMLIDHGADICLTIPYPNPLHPKFPIVYETIFERAIRCNNPLYLFVFLKSTKGITKSTISKALILAKFGFKNSDWGNTLWPKALAQKNLRANFKTMGQILKRYYFTMRTLGFENDNKDADWQRNYNSMPVPVEIAKKIAFYAAKDAHFTSFEKGCLIKLFGNTKNAR